MTTLAVVGAGRWGRNLIRNFHSLPQARLKWVVDLDEERLGQVRALFPDVATDTDLDRVLGDDEVEAVVVATSAPTHCGVARRVLRAGRDAYVEKPLALRVEDAEELVALAGRGDRILMTGHLLLCHPALLRLKAFLDAGDLGDLHYLYSQRLNLGVIRRDENALWSLAPHDLSAMRFLVGRPAATVAAQGAACLTPRVEDVVFVNVRFEGGVMGQAHISWLDPQKVRRLTVVGSRKMAVFDDMAPQEKIRIFDRGADLAPDYPGFGDQIGLRFGDIWSPRVDPSEPLRLECEHFLACVRDRTTPRSDGAAGVEVVRMLEAASRSLREGGVPVALP